MRISRRDIPLWIGMAALSALLTSGCGSDGSGSWNDLADPGPTATKGQGASSAKPARQPLTQAQVEAVVLGQGDVPASHRAQRVPTDGAIPRADLEKCRPVLELLTLNGGMIPARSITGTNVVPLDNPKAVTAIVLASYDLGQAEKIFTSAKAAIPGCKTINATLNGTALVYQVELRPAPTFGSESLTLRLDTNAKGQSIATGYTIVRVENTIAEMVFVDAGTRQFALPDEGLIRTQTEKLLAGSG